MTSTIGIVLNNLAKGDLRRITEDKIVDMLPFGSKYRLIDFSLSNLVNSDTNYIGVMGSYRSLKEYIGIGREWFFNTKKHSLEIFEINMDNQQKDNNHINIEDINDNLKYFKQNSKYNILLFTSGDVVMNNNYKNLIKFHRNNNSHITILYKPIDKDTITNELDAGLEVDKSNNVKSIGKIEDKKNNLFTGTFVINQNTLIDLLSKEEDKHKNDFLKLINHSLTSYKVLGYPFNRYFMKINSINKYIKSNIDILNSNIRKELLLGNNKIFTKIYDNHPTKYDKKTNVKNSSLGSGCNIKGSVENSIIFDNVVIEEKAVVKNSVIMGNVTIGKGTVLKNSIVTKNSKIENNLVYKGLDNSPLIIDKCIKKNKEVISSESFNCSF